MTLEQLLKLNESDLKKEHAKAMQLNDADYCCLVNTVRLSRILSSALYIYRELKEKKVEIPYYEQDGKKYLCPKFRPDGHGVLTHFENVSAAHIGFRYPIVFDLDILKLLVPNTVVEFVKKEKELSFPAANILNFGYETDDTMEIKTPDIWVPNGDEELDVAISDMPTNDPGAVLMQGVSSRFVISGYITEKPVFTDVFYSPNVDGEMPKAIILNEIAGVKGEALEQGLDDHNVLYKRIMSTSPKEEIPVGQLVPANIDLSTIWTAKTLDIVEAAITDSESKEGFSDLPADIYIEKAKILTRINAKPYNLGLEVIYDTIIIFDGKLILYSAINNDNRMALINLFKSKGIIATIRNKEIDLSMFVALPEDHKM